MWSFEVMVCHTAHDVILERFYFIAKLCSPVYAFNSGYYVCVVLNLGFDV